MVKLFKITALLALILASPALGQSEQVQGHLEQANQLYLQNDFQGALNEYRKVESSGFGSSTLYYNLGNSYYKLGQIPSAILYYERARLLNPRDEDILFNLNLANQLVVDQINPLKVFFLRSWFDSIASLLKPDTWGIIGLLSFLILAAIAIALYATQGKRLRKTGITLGSVLIFFIGLSLAFGTISNRTLNHRKYAIVFAPTLTAKSSPDASGTDLFVIHEGLKVRITETVGGWSRIRLPDGNEAWVPDSAVTRI